MYIYHIFFIHSSVDGHLCCFHVLDIVNSVAIGIANVFWNYAFSSVLVPGALGGLGDADTNLNPSPIHPVLGRRHTPQSTSTVSGQNEQG